MEPSDIERLERLEREMAILRTEFARLRGGAPAAARQPPVYAPSAAPIRMPSPVTAAPIGTEPIAPPAPQNSIEDMVGRYATLAVATITVLTGFGFFLSWTIHHGLLSPTVRVVLGYAGAAGVAMGGTRLRLKGTRDFGNVLLALALAVVHIVSWSAGPLLHVLPSIAALGISLGASVVLAEFALRHDEELLCAIGFGGAAIAPFVTADKSGNVAALGIYGLVVIAMSAAALRDRAWKIALRVTIVSAAVYTLVMSAASPIGATWPQVARRTGVLFPAALILLLIPVAHSRHRRRLLLTSGLGLAFGAAAHALVHGPDMTSMIVTILGAVIAVGTLDMTRASDLENESAGIEANGEQRSTRAAIDAFILPVGLLVGVIAVGPDMPSLTLGGIAAFWAIGATTLARRARGLPEATAFAGAATIAAVIISPVSWLDGSATAIVGAVVTALILLDTGERIKEWPYVAGASVSLALASGWSLVALARRPDFDYVPFLTPASGIALTVSLAWLAASAFTRRSDYLSTLKLEGKSIVHTLFAWGGGLTAFLWGRAELLSAWSPTASTALTIVYYAAVGTALIWAGRSRHIAILRGTGLALTLLAAGKALAEAVSIQNIAVRVGTFFAVSAFLIGVGYWYRRRPDDVVMGEPLVEPT